MNIEEYAAQFPTIKREDIKGGQTVLAQSEDFFVQHVAHSCESFSSYKTLRLVKDIEPQFEDGFYVNPASNRVWVRQNGAWFLDGSLISEDGAEQYYPLTRLYTPAQLVDTLRDAGWSRTALGLEDAIAQVKL
jgi:hypothetical protein